MFSINLDPLVRSLERIRDQLEQSNILTARSLELSAESLKQTADRYKRVEIQEQRIVDISRKALERQFVDEVLAAVAARFKHEAVDELLEEFRSKMNVVSGDTP